jgi:hypothetical protein
LRTRLSPVPTQITLSFCGSIRTAPIDCVCSSKTGLKLTPPSIERQTPPLAVPTKICSGSDWLASMLAIRPLIVAGPIARARMPPNKSES